MSRAKGLDHDLVAQAWLDASAFGDDAPPDTSPATQRALHAVLTTSSGSRLVALRKEVGPDDVKHVMEIVRRGRPLKLVEAGEPEPTAALVPEEVSSLNDDWFVLDEGGHIFACRFMVEYLAGGQAHRTLIRYSFRDFERKMERQRVLVGESHKRLGRAWLEWSGRRQYDHAVFDPTRQETSPDVLNLWTGWAIPPLPGDWARVRAHIEDVICSGIREHWEYLLNWLAFMFQQPRGPGQVVVVLRGKEGAGKSILCALLRRILGPHGLMVSDPRHVLGNFNAHLRDLLFLEASEAFFAGDRAQANRMKALITDDSLVIEQKGVDSITVPNLLHIMMTSNEDWTVSAGPESRRFFVLDVSDGRVGDAAYFKNLWKDVNDPGVGSAMLDYLLKRDLSDFDVRRFPVTDALIGQRARSVTGVFGWALDLADRGELTGRNGVSMGWREFYVTRDLYEDFVHWTREQRYERSMPAGSFGRALTNDLGLQWISECPRALATGLHPQDARRPGYLVGKLEDFRQRAHSAAGLIPTLPPDKHRAGNSTAEATSDSSDASDGRGRQVGWTEPSTESRFVVSLSSSSGIGSIGSIGTDGAERVSVPTLSTASDTAAVGSGTASRVSVAEVLRRHESASMPMLLAETGQPHDVVLDELDQLNAIPTGDFWRLPVPAP
jgi:hypothetical protein